MRWLLDLWISKMGAGRMAVTRAGIPSSPESLAESEKCWKDIEESIELVYKGDKKNGSKNIKSKSNV